MNSARPATDSGSTMRVYDEPKLGADSVRSGNDWPKDSCLAGEIARLPSTKTDPAHGKDHACQTDVASDAGPPHSHALKRINRATGTSRNKLAMTPGNSAGRLSDPETSTDILTVRLLPISTILPVPRSTLPAQLGLQHRMGQVETTRRDHSSRPLVETALGRRQPGLL
jgi:hypothetical protein